MDRRLASMVAGVAAAAFCAIGYSGAGDPNPAMSQPDTVAWRLFTTVTRPAAPDDRHALFETWASDLDTFTNSPQWPRRTRGASEKTLINRLGKTDATGSRWASAPALRCELGKIDACVGKETLRNRAAFDFIVHNKLNTRQGLAAAFGGAISFPIEAIEVKAEWIPVTQLEAWNGVTPAQATSLYYVNSARVGGQSVSVALVALHVISKEVPNWTWATFEHWKNPGRCDGIGCRDDFGALQAEVKTNAKPNRGYPACPHTETLKQAFVAVGLADVWLNYCLKGSQTNFITASGATVLLGNSVSETINAGVPPPHSSCMTCHAEAAADKDGNAAKVRLLETGAPQPSWFVGDGSPPAPQYRQADFVWAVPLCAVAADGVSACAPAPQPAGK